MSTYQQERSHGNSGDSNIPSSHEAHDASRVPPSKMQEFRGEPTIEHDYPEDSKHKRHSVSHQELQFVKGMNG